MAREMISIRSNHDRWLVELAPEKLDPSDRAAFEQLQDQQLAWLRALPPTHEIGDEVFFCHGTPADDNCYWMEQVGSDGSVTKAPRAAIEREAAGLDHAVLLCAHTHTQRAVRLSGGRMLVNPGSVGCPAYSDEMPMPHIMQTGSPDACYAVLEKDTAGSRVTFRQVPYDASRMAHLAAQAGREDWARAVATGWLTP